MGSKHEVFYLGIDFLDVNAYAVYLKMMGYDYHKLMLSFWTFPFNIKPEIKFHNLADRFEFHADAVQNGLMRFYGLERRVQSLKSHQQLYDEIVKEERAGNPMLWLTDSKILPYHWTYQNDETNHKHIVVALKHTRDHIYIIDPGWVDDVYMLEKSEIERSVHNFRVVINSTNSQDYHYEEFSYVAAKLTEGIEEESTTIFERMEKFNNSIRKDFLPDHEIVLVDNNRSKIWRNPFIRSLNEIAKYRYHLSEAFLSIWGDTQENVRWVAEHFLEVSKQWNTLKFMFAHVLMQNHMEESQMETLYLSAVKILEAEKQIYFYLKSI